MRYAIGYSRKTAESRGKTGVCNRVTVVTSKMDMAIKLEAWLADIPSFAVPIGYSGYRCAKNRGITRVFGL